MGGEASAPPDPYMYNLLNKFLSRVLTRFARAPYGRDKLQEPIGRDMADGGKTLAARDGHDDAGGGM